MEDALALSGSTERSRQSPSDRGCEDRFAALFRSNSTTTASNEDFKMLRLLYLSAVVLIAASCSVGSVEAQGPEPRPVNQDQVAAGGTENEAGGENVATWTPEQRMAKRDLVVKGKIRHVVKPMNRTNTRGAETWGGVIVVDETVKGDITYDKGDSFPFWFEQGLPMGKGKKRANRTPPFPRLKRGDKGTFYLTLMSPEVVEQVGEKPTTAKLFMMESAYDFVPQ
ncbi:MAG: hypothetical protein KDA59_14180 [Planctomycetales bacterium]|nr:hypothetical protein [Planctomycetales bacterium]